MLKSEIRILTVILTAITLFLIAQTVIVSQTPEGTSDDRYIHWEKLYLQASELTTAAWQTQDGAMRDRLLREANQVYQTILNSYPDDVSSWSNMAANLYHLGEIEKALVEYTKLIQKHPDTYSAYQSRGYIYEEKGLFERALRDYEAFLRLIIDMPGEVKAQQREEYQAKINMLRGKLKLQDTSTKGYYQLGC